MPINPMFSKVSMWKALKKAIVIIPKLIKNPHLNALLNNCFKSVNFGYLFL